MSTTETLPDPEEILDDSRIQYQAMTELSDEEYRRLADDIRERGVLQPIVTDENGTILDGHHRAALAEHFDLDESREPAYVVIGDLDEDAEKLARAIKQNVLGRDTKDAVKSHAVEQYIETSWDRTGDGDLIRPETDSEVAEKLGVSEQTVGRVVKNFQVEIIYHDRVKAREYYEKNPDASYREVSEQVDTSRPTVAEWLKEDFDEGDDDDDDSDGDASLAAFSVDREEAKNAGQTFQKAKSDGTSDDVKDTAERKAEQIAKNETDASDAVKIIETREDIEETETSPEESSSAKSEVEEIEVLNLYAGIGGNRKLWGDDVNVTAVEYNPDIAEAYRDFHPDDTVIVDDAHEYLLNHYDEFDVIWSSPPCPTHSKMQRTFVNGETAMNENRDAVYPDMSLYQQIILLRNFFDGQYIVENVESYYDPLIEPQESGRHYFWSNFDVPEVETPELDIQGNVERYEDMYGFDLDGYTFDSDYPKVKVLRNCVHPKLGKAILDAAKESADIEVVDNVE